jgi:hypothetical protein
MSEEDAISHYEKGIKKLFTAFSQKVELKHVLDAFLCLTLRCWQDEKGTRFLDYDSLADLLEIVGIMPQLMTEDEVTVELPEFTKVIGNICRNLQERPNIRICYNTIHCSATHKTPGTN